MSSTHYIKLKTKTKSQREMRNYYTCLKKKKKFYQVSISKGEHAARKTGNKILIYFIRNMKKKDLHIRKTKRMLQGTGE